MNVLSLLTAAGAMVAAANFGLRIMDQGETADAGSTHASSLYVMRSPGGDLSCAVSRGQPVSSDLSPLTVSPGCATLLPGIEQARYWRDVDDATVAFSATGADRIVTFGVADGAGYESFGPGVPLISLASAD